MKRRLGTLRLFHDPLRDDLVSPGAFKRAIYVMETHPDVHLTFGREFTRIWGRADP